LRSAERVLARAAAPPGHALLEIRVDGLLGEQPPIELALDIARERGPVAPHDLHADELDLAAPVQHAGVALARSAHAVAGVRKEELRIELLELELEPARDSPPRRDMPREVAGQLLGERRALRERGARVLRAGQHEQAVRIAVQHLVAAGLEPALRP